MASHGLAQREACRRRHDPEIQSRLYRFLDSVASGRHGGLAVYRPVPGQLPTTAMTAEALATRRLIQYPLKPAADDEATITCYKHYRDAAKRTSITGTTRRSRFFKSKMKLGESGTTLSKLISSLRKIKVRQHRLVDPRCIWSGYGGRVYSTAMSCLCLEVYYRYLPLYQHFPTSSPSKTLQWQTARRLPRRCVDESS